MRMHVARTPSKYVDKAGNVRRYESVLVRRTYRDGRKVRHETLANLSKLPAEVIAAVAAMAHQLGLPALLGPPCRARDLALGLIISRVVRPTSKLSTLGWWADCTLGVDLDLAGASTDEIYAAMDWLADRQAAIETKLAATHLSLQVNPSRMAL